MNLDTADFTTIKVDRVGAVVRLTIAHPNSEVNAVDSELHGDLTLAFRLLRQEDRARAAILTGRGRAFSAGGDFDWFPSLRTVAQLAELRRHAKQLIWDLVDVRDSDRRR
jgi:enoyl-CoA hydratase